MTDSGSTPRVLVIEHESTCTVAYFEEWMAPARVSVSRPYQGEPIPPVEDFDALLVLGGAMGARDDDRCGWLPQARERIRQAANSAIPTLGICLGHQLIAVALDGAVERNPEGRQFGLTPIGWLPEAAEDPLFSGLVAGSRRGLHYNDDIVQQLPAQAVLLARGPGGEVQAVRYTEWVWGVQWHPEVTGTILGEWLASDPTADLALGLDQVSAALDATGELVESWRPMAARFAELAGLTASRNAPS